MDISKLSHRYTGNCAKDYDKKRVGENKWSVEERIVESLLAQFPKGSSILDIPVGAGRFIALYKKFNLRVTGIDASKDMLDESKKKVTAQNFKVVLKEGSIFDIRFSEGHFDIVLCIRFLNWIDYDNLSVAVKEITRVAQRNLIIGVRHLTPFSDIAVYTPLGMMRFIRQCIMRLRKSFEKQKLVFHKKRDIDSLFEKYNLKVSEAAQVEKRADGTDYFIYLLRKEQQGG
jgi:ubiquinone/menaquinone biosynthesis C-methylase UbiE